MATNPIQKFRARVASARRVNVDSAESVKATIAKRQNWQEDFWAYYDEMPEVKFALLFLSNGMQKVRFFAATQDEDGNVVPINDEASPLQGTPIAAAAEIEMARIGLGLAGQGEINRLLTLNLEGPGECHLHGISAIEPIGVPELPGYVPGREESWDVRSVSELEFSNQNVMDENGVSRPKILIKRAPDDKGVEYDPKTETLIRFWTRHPRFTEWADSHARSVMGDCEMLTLLAGEAKAVSKSRHTAGAFTLPAELSFVDDSADGDEPQVGDEKANPFIDAFMKHQLDPVTDPASPSSVQRLVISGPAEFLRPDVLRTIDLSRPADDKLTEKMDRHIQRLARGLNVPVEVVMGHMSTTFSNAEQISQDKFDDHFEPRCVGISDGYAFGFLRPQLLAADFLPEDVMRVVVGFDATALVRDESLDQKADTLLEHGAISLEAYRRIRGVLESDAPNEAERLRALAERKGILTGDLVLALFRASGVDLGLTVDQGKVSDTEDGTTPAPDTKAAPVEDAPVVAAGGFNLGKQLAEIDRQLRNRLAGAIDMAMSRALERAGNKLKTAGPQSLRASVRSIPARRCAAHLGPALIAQAGITQDDLLAGAWDELAIQFKAWAGEAGDATVKSLARYFTTGLTEKEMASLKVRQVTNIDEAWTWLESSLSEAGRKALFAPEVGVAEMIAEGVGELDTLSHVPSGILREALARAGGATGFISKAGVLTSSNKTPIGGIATGEDVSDVLSHNGAGIEGYTWVYGPARRRGFEPHEQLGGTFFENFDDDVLTNTTGWPDTAFYYPGDHNGCVCDFEPSIYLVAGNANRGTTAGPIADRLSEGE